MHNAGRDDPGCPVGADGSLVAADQCQPAQFWPGSSRIRSIWYQSPSNQCQQGARIALIFEGERTHESCRLGWGMVQIEMRRRGAALTKPRLSSAETALASPRLAVLRH